MRQKDNQTLLMTMLYDFYGDLLTDKQREYFDLYHNEDLSLSEIAERTGISKQGVFDIISRAQKSLNIIEQKTEIISRWLKMQSELDHAADIADELLRLSIGDDGLNDLASELVATLKGLKGAGG